MTDDTAPDTIEESVVYKYRGRKSGDHMLGIPARDLTQSDVDALPDDLRAELEGHVDEKGMGQVYKRIDNEGAEADAPAPRRRGGKKGEAADPLVPGATDADQVNLGQSPYLNIPPNMGDPATPVTTVPVVGSPPLPPGQVQSDKLA